MTIKSIEQLNQASKYCKTYYFLIEELLKDIRQYTTGKTFRITKELSSNIPDGYNYLRKEKRLCIVDNIIFYDGKICATVKVINKKNK